MGQDRKIRLMGGPSKAWTVGLTQGPFRLSDTKIISWAADPHYINLRYRAFQAHFLLTMMLLMTYLAGFRRPGVDAQAASAEGDSTLT